MNAPDRLRHRKAVITFLLPLWFQVLPALAALVLTAFQGSWSIPRWSLFAIFIGGIVTGAIGMYLGFLLLVRSGLIEEEQRALQRRATIGEG